MPYVRCPGHFISHIKYSQVVNDLARHMIDELSSELPWVKAALPDGVYSVCDRALGRRCSKLAKTDACEYHNAMNRNQQ